jgi:hypothetical protein
VAIYAEANQLVVKTFRAADAASSGGGADAPVNAALSTEISIQSSDFDSYDFVSPEDEVSPSPGHDLVPPNYRRLHVRSVVSLWCRASAWSSACVSPSRC